MFVTFSGWVIYQSIDKSLSVATFSLICLIFLLVAISSWRHANHIYKITKVVRFPYAHISFGKITNKLWREVIRTPSTIIGNSNLTYGLRDYIRCACLLTHNFYRSQFGFRVYDHESNMTNRLDIEKKSWLKWQSCNAQFIRGEESQFSYWKGTSICHQTQTWELHKSNVDKKKSKNSKRNSNEDNQPVPLQIYKQLQILNDNKKKIIKNCTNIKKNSVINSFYKKTFIF